MWVLIGWGAAIVIAVVVLGFCAYEVLWKAKRLRTDLEQLQELGARLQLAAQDLGEAQLRATTLRSGA